MPSLLRTLALPVILLATILLASGACADDDKPEATATPSVTASPTESPAATPRITPSATPAPTIAPFTAVFTTSDGSHVPLSIEVADTPEERSVGLMNRESLPEDSGMLFDFRGVTNSGFWMRNTLIPLSIAFITEDDTIVHIEDMEPLTENLHFSPDLYRYAIEVNQGWYARNGIAVGDTVAINAGG